MSELECRVCLRVRNKALYRALAAVISGAGWHVASGSDRVECSVVVSTEADITPEECMEVSRAGRFVVILMGNDSVCARERYLRAGASACLPIGAAGKELIELIAPKWASLALAGTTPCSYRGDCDGITLRGHPETDSGTVNLNARER